MKTVPLIFWRNAKPKSHIFEFHDEFFFIKIKMCPRILVILQVHGLEAKKVVKY